MSDYQYDLPFDIIDVARILNIRIKRPGRKSVYADCPLCGDTRGKLNLNLEKNQFRCNYCQESGGAIALYAKLHGVSNAVAYHEICEILYKNAPKKEYTSLFLKKPKPDLPKSSELASLYDRNRTYEMMLSMLQLTEKHIDDLIDRGLSIEQIERFGFKSTPAFGFPKIAKALKDKGCVIEGVPGFYEKVNGEWTINFNSRCSGILIPYRSVSGMIQAFQIRLDEPFSDKKGKKTKYIWLSSVDEEKGVSSGSPAHFIGDPCDKSVFVTEGGLKAYIAHSLSGRTFIANAGVGNVESFKEPFRILKENGTEKMYEACDMDKTVNVNVEKGVKNLIRLIKEYGFSVKSLKWSWDSKMPKMNKGIDDMLLSKKKENM